MKIAYVLDFFYPYIGGVQTLFFNLAKQMAKRGHEVSVLTSSCGSDKSFEIIDGINVYRFGKSRTDFLPLSLFDSHFRSKKFDLIHTSTYPSIIPSYFLSRLKKIPSILTVHEVWPLKLWTEVLGPKGIFYFLEERALLSFPFSRYTCPSNYTKEALASTGVDFNRIDVIPHGIDNVFSPDMKKYRKEIRSELGLSDNSVVGYFIGRPGVSKGITYLLKALLKVFNQTDLKFLFLVSKQPKDEYNRFLRLVNNSKLLSKNILLVEPRKSHEFVAKLIGSSDFVVVPSLTEGFGFVAAEAVSSGVSAIVSSAGSLPDIVEDGVDGMHVAPRNIECLSNAIIKITKSKELRRRLQGSRKKFSTWGDVTKRYEKIYKNLC